MPGPGWEVLLVALLPPNAQFQAGVERPGTAFGPRAANGFCQPAGLPPRLTGTLRCVSWSCRTVRKVTRRSPACKANPLIQGETGTRGAGQNPASLRARCGG